MKFRIAFSFLFFLLLIQARQRAAAQTTLIAGDILFYRV